MARNLFSLSWPPSGTAGTLAPIPPLTLSLSFSTPAFAAIPCSPASSPNPFLLCNTLAAFTDAPAQANRHSAASTGCTPPSSRSCAPPPRPQCRPFPAVCCLRAQLAADASSCEGRESIASEKAADGPQPFTASLLSTSSLLFSFASPSRPLILVPGLAQPSSLRARSSKHADLGFARSRGSSGRASPFSSPCLTTPRRLPSSADLTSRPNTTLSSQRACFRSTKKGTRGHVRSGSWPPHLLDSRRPPSRPTRPDTSKQETLDKLQSRCPAESSPVAQGSLCSLAPARILPGRQPTRACLRSCPHVLPFRLRPYDDRPTRRARRPNDLARRPRPNHVRPLSSSPLLSPPPPLEPLTSLSPS